MYIDCDGVIFDTINACAKMMEKEGKDSKNGQLMHEYFLETDAEDWHNFFHVGGILQNAIIKIKRIIKSGKFKDVKILTKTCGSLAKICNKPAEEKIKRYLFDSLLPGTEVITVPFDEDKNDYVDVKGNILIDDTMKNISKWQEAGGIGIFFNIDTKEKADFDHDEISDLGDLFKTKSLRNIEDTDKKKLARR